MKLTIDFETSSDVSLRDVGAWMYSRHPSTEVMCVGWSDGALEHGQWKRGNPPPRDLIRLVLMAGVVEAHNAFFEYCIWYNVCVFKYKWPPVMDIKWRCSASKAAAMGLPRSLGEGGRAMGLAVVKDEAEGRSAMLKLSRGKGKDDDWPLMLRYNMNDVHSEEALSDSTADLSAEELEVWRMSERMNRRGFAVDVEGCRAAVKMAGEYARVMTARFSAITGLDTAGQRAKFQAWLNAGRVSGPPVTNTQADTLDALLATQTGVVREAVGIVRALGRSSIKKYRALLSYADRDGRVRGCFLYHGAHTGRWSGSGPQPQNFKRECPWDMSRLWEDIRTGDLDQFIMLYGDPLKALGEATRGAIWSPDGKLNVGDYAQIEPRMLFWLCDERQGLDTFREGKDIYVEMATTIWGGRWRCVGGHQKYTKHCVHCDMMRFLGKHAILALGFGAGFVKFLVHCRDLGAPRFSWKQVCELVPAGQRDAILNWIMDKGWDAVRRHIPHATVGDARELVLTKYIVDKYRARYKATVVKLWYALEDAARAAVGEPGKTFKVGAMSYTMGKKFLACRLPSGRVIRYPYAAVRGKDITYMTSEKGKWVRTKTYGGKLTENVVQAASRDVMSEAMIRLEQAGHELVMTIHDEVVGENGDLGEFTEILSRVPDWARGLPIKVETFATRRYRK